MLYCVIYQARRHEVFKRFTGNSLWPIKSADRIKLLIGRLKLYAVFVFPDFAFMQPDF